MVINITKLSFYDLKYLILKANLVTKTMIFINKIINIMIIAGYFCCLLSLKN